MIIENVEALKSWLAKLLEPICDADPSALANYVVALVKKDKPEKELKALCADQLDVFLQKETIGFVDKLFECLTTKNYLGNPAAKEAPKEEVKPTPIKSDVVEAETPEEERENRWRRSPLRNRSDFESRSRDDRRREERKRRDFDRHGKSGSDSHRERERHERRRGSPRGRSYSRSRSRSRSRTRSRSGSRGKSRDREHRGGRDFKSKFEVERKDADGYNSSTTSNSQQQHSSPLLPLPAPPHPFSSSSSSSTGVSGAGGVPIATPAHLPDSTTDSWSGYYGAQRQDSVGKPFTNKSASLKQRCRDYDEKGFCVRGDHCPFDHGNDPLIVDDVNLPNMIPFPPPPVMPPAGMPMPPITKPPPSIRMPSLPPYGQPPPPGIFPMTGPPLIVTSGIDTPNHQSAITSSPPIGPPGVGLPPTLPPPTPPPPASSSTSVSLRPQYVQSEYNYDPEGYNPESPALTAAVRNPYRQFIPRVQTQRSNLIGLTSSEGQGSRAANIVIQTEPSIATSTPGGNVSRFNTEPDSRKRTMAPSTTEGPAVKKPWMEKPNFNNQNKNSFTKKNHYVNTKLEVRKIPRELNNITKLNEHFSKFGTIVNIQVAFGGDPEAALIQYTKNEEARRAISNTEAVLNNRFIRVYWHREPGNSTTGLQQQDQSSGSQVAGSAPSQGPQHSNVHKHNPAAYVLNKTALKHRLPTAAGTTSTTKPDSLNPNTDTVTVAPPLTNTQKGPYTSTTLKSSSKSLGKTGKALEAQEVLKKKQEALKLQQDMRKKKQEMLKTQIECQKALINRLEKNRGMKPEERANIMKTLKDLTDKITQLQNEMNPASQVSSAKGNHSQPKTMNDAQKALLDAELDFHKKMSSGEDTSDLKKKLGQLKVEATRLGLIRPSTGRGRGRGKMALEHGSMPIGRGRGRSREIMARGGALNRMVVDHRPRALAIIGVTQEEKEELRPHFVKFGEIEDLRDQDANSVVMTFKTRSEAENAANQGAKFKGRVLQISWYKPKTPSVTTEPEEEEVKDEDNAKEASSYLPGEEDEEEEEEDDDEDDEYESRSWRR
ncbi:RNA-binding protein 27 isoform X2 [Mastacembelus armatus]|uniref:RNA binding motif protein 27 n=1 Tax=Mastacembelus armatus TaxID=205130 RepID=A0A7N8XPN7_9TELE|nr:RNA-binding protein 27 isoform X2 [Mastacembelus armatus]